MLFECSSVYFKYSFKKQHQDRFCSKNEKSTTMTILNYYALHKKKADSFQYFIYMSKLHNPGALL